MVGFKLPKDFLIGTGHSAFQSEGAVDRDGKTENWMDHIAKERAGKPATHFEKTGATFSSDLTDNGCFFYDNYEEYVEDMQKTGQNTFRFSLSWCRILPNGVGEVNPKGIAYYNKLIDKLLSCGIEPFVDLYHWDMPMCIADQGAFLNPKFPEWFEYYAKVCFEAFGDRVKLWSTFNESQISIHNGYRTGSFAPCHQDEKEYCTASLYCILAHFRAVRLYKSMNLGGKIGAVHAMLNVAPVHLNDEDLGAVERAMEHYFGWWTEPMVNGTFPRTLLRQYPHLDKMFPEGYQEMLDKWFAPMDFVGLNYYMSKWSHNDPDSYLGYKRVESFYSAPGQAFTPYPPGLFDVVQYVSEKYPTIDIYITENGCATENIHDEEKECDDTERVTYLREHLRECARLIRAGYTRLKGYYYWCDADAFENGRGYELRFGLTWVDHKTGKRTWKKSRHYFSNICKTHMVD